MTFEVRLADGDWQRQWHKVCRRFELSVLSIKCPEGVAASLQCWCSTANIMHAMCLCACIFILNSFGSRNGKLIGFVSLYVCMCSAIVVAE